MLPCTGSLVFQEATCPGDHLHPPALLRVRCVLSYFTHTVASRQYSPGEAVTCPFTLRVYGDCWAWLCRSRPPAGGGGAGVLLSQSHQAGVTPPHCKTGSQTRSRPTCDVGRAQRQPLRIPVSISDEKPPHLRQRLWMLPTSTVSMRLIRKVDDWQGALLIPTLVSLLAGRASVVGANQTWRARTCCA